MNPEDSESQDMKRGLSVELGQEGRRVRDRVGREASVGPCRPIGQAGPMGSSLDSMIRSREWRH